MWVTTPTSPPSRSTGTVHANRSPRVQLSSTARPMPPAPWRPSGTGNSKRDPNGRSPPRCPAATSSSVPDSSSRHTLTGRPGRIVGPHEDVARLPWWLPRLARGGTVIAPGEPGRPVRLTDARDLATWLVDNTRRKNPGNVTVAGPDGTTFGELLAVCSEITEADRTAPATLRWVADGALLAAGVEPWMELPMWAPDIPELAGTWQVSGDRAVRT